MSEENKKQWKETGGFAEDSDVAQVVCKEEDIKQWDEEADEADLSRSKYLYKLIQEGRAYREHGAMRSGGDQKRIQELKEEVAELEQRLEEKESESSAVISFEPATLRTVLTDNYQELDEILRSIVESGVLDEALRQPVENQLYFLAAQDEVDYERGWGWKLVDSDNGGDA
ncbi:hypothetical protein KY092_07790 [Natronomonas gomsonensis]|uniref:hypothetical protein n=1 Tax=Natronomonas gomsonensis TaxID=1046043 RepID=UPI0020CA28DF|nr:hypothetical protein [Natronomonas gomsonensis]MCY4730457.1 hypothetical protein [Natronomonas gomsonensis]